MTDATMLTPGQRVLALHGLMWEGAEVVYPPANGNARIHFLRLSAAFDEDLPFAKIRLPLPQDEIAPSMIATLHYPMHGSAANEQFDINEIEDNLLALEGYLPGTLQIDQRSRQVQLKVIRDSRAQSHAKFALLRGGLFTGPETIR